MNIETGEIRDSRDLTEVEINSKDWIEIGKKKQKTLSEYELIQKKVNLGERSPLSNEARNKRKKRKKMSQKSRIKNRSK